MHDAAMKIYSDHNINSTVVNYAKATDVKAKTRSLNAKATAFKTNLAKADKNDAVSNLRKRIFA